MKFTQLRHFFGIIWGGFAICTACNAIPNLLKAKPSSCGDGSSKVGFIMERSATASHK
jgi:hypothetical protein